MLKSVSNASGTFSYSYSLSLFYFFAFLFLEVEFQLSQLSIHIECLRINFTSKMTFYSTCPWFIHTFVILRAHEKDKFRKKTFTSVQMLDELTTYKNGTADKFNF